MPIKTPISKGRTKQAKNVAKPGMRSLSKKINTLMYENVKISHKYPISFH